MGTKVQIENYLPGHCSMKDISHESNGTGWPSCYGEGNLPNGQFYYGFLPRTVANSHPEYEKDTVKQTMLEHEAVFKNQVYELHRLYRVQRDLMDEARRKEQFKRQIPYEMSSSSSPVPPQMQSEGAQRWNGAGLPMESPIGGKAYMSGPDTTQSSPNSVKGKSVQPVPVPFQSCYSPKNSEVSESRPTKFRKGMLDLQLPADQYIGDEVEQFGGAKTFDLTSPSPDKNINPASASGKMFLNYAAKMECQGEASSSDLHNRRPKALADLNEPFHVEEIATVSSVDFLGNGSGHSDRTYRDLSTRLLSSSKDLYQNCKKGGMNGSLNNFHENRANGQDWFCYTLESERNKGSVRSINQGVHPEKAPVSSQALHVVPDQLCQSPAFLSGDHIKREPWKAKYAGISEKSDRCYTSSPYIIAEPMTASHNSSQPGLFHSPELGKSWDQSASSWGKQSNFLIQKPASVHNNPLLSAANLSKSPQSSAHSNDLFGNKWNLNISPGANAAFRSELPVRNGFYQGASAAYKELPVPFPPAGVDHVNCSYSDKTLPCASNSYFKATSSIDVNQPVREMNLNVALPNGVYDDHVNSRVKITGKDCKSEDSLAALPWLRGKGASNNNAETWKKCLNSEFCRVPSVLSTSNEVDTTAKKPETSRKILGVSICENPPLPKEKSAVINPDIYHPSRIEEINSRQRTVGFDMNFPCELIDSELDKMAVDEAVVAKKIKTESGSFKNHFDLNSCITEEEMPCEVSHRTIAKVSTGIDLEAPAALEDEDFINPMEQMKEENLQHPELQPDSSRNDGEAELLASAAAAIVAISSCAVQLSTEKTTYLPPDDDVDDPLQWFVDIACSGGNTVDNKMVEDDGLPEGIDDFEAMILRLKECTFEEYFPKPSIPEFPVVETSTCVLTTRTRKGQARRGRQRRDFQRDILPGLTTLSRHEVTEDLQTFGGLMRATGHSWQSGPNRRNATRNGSARGRRRTTAAAPVLTNTVCALPLKQQQQQLQQQVHINNPEVGLEDRSLTGWGKTTRRPRRQRCPAGNPAPPVPLT